jgi:hypothetical protein
VDLVIYGVLPHFTAGMCGYVRVLPNGCTAAAFPLRVR